MVGLDCGPSGGSGKCHHTECMLADIRTRNGPALWVWSRWTFSVKEQHGTIRTGRDEKKGKTQEEMERGSRKRSSSAGSEKMERVGGR